MKFSTPFTLLAMTLMSNTDARIGGDGSGHRNLIDYSKLKKCDPHQNPTYTPQCLSEGKGYKCIYIKRGRKNGDYRCLDRSQSTPTVAPTMAPTPTSKENCARPGTGYFWCDATNECLPPGEHDKCDAASKKDCARPGTGYFWCDVLNVCLPPAEHGKCDAASKKDCAHPGTGYFWCDETNECLPPSDHDKCESAKCTAQSGSTGYSWCVLTSTCLAPGDDSCDIANCKNTKKSGKNDWCFSTRECIPSTDNCDPKSCTVDDDCNLPSKCNVILGGEYQCY